MSNQTVSAAALRSAIEATTDGRALELEDHDGYVCDAVAEIADYDVSIYTAEQIAYCREHADSMRYASLGRLAAEFGDDLDAEAWAAVDDATDWEDNNARIEDITDGAAEAYREALEGDDGEED